SMAARKTTHGLARHPLYSTWRNMLARCEDPRDRAYADYGGRGITVCAEWHDLARFIADIEAEIGPRPEGTYPSGRTMWTLNRKDNDGPYARWNVEWADALGQARNRRARRRAVRA